MGTKKVKKAGDPAAEGVAAGATLVQESERKKKKKVKAKAKSEIDDIFGQKAQVDESEKKVKAKSEIDDIFGQKKRKKVEGEDEQAAAKKKDKETSEVVKLNSKGELVKPKKPQVAKPAKSAPAAAAPTSRRKTEDGFTVYSAEELGFNKKNAGGTKLCPFDCDCCF
jgi:hypothetical protein